MTSEDKSNLLGLFFWIFTAFNVLILGVMAIFFFVFFGVMFSQMPQRANDPPPEFFFAIFSFVFFLILITTVLFSIPKVVAGYGLRNHKPWARTWTLVASVMCCLSFPVGTAIGIFGLIFLFSDEGKQYFDDLAYGRLASAAPVGISPPPNSWQ